MIALFPLSMILFENWSQLLLNWLHILGDPVIELCSKPLNIRKICFVCASSLIELEEQFSWLAQNEHLFANFYVQNCYFVIVLIQTIVLMQVYDSFYTHDVDTPSLFRLSISISCFYYVCFISSHSLLNLLCLRNKHAREEFDAARDIIRTFCESCDITITGFTLIFFEYRGAAKVIHKHMCVPLIG